MPGKRKAALPEWLTRQQAAEALGVTVRSVDRYADDPRVRLHRYRSAGIVGAGNVRFKRVEVAALAEARKSEPAAGR